MVGSQLFTSYSVLPGFFGAETQRWRIWLTVSGSNSQSYSGAVIADGGNDIAEDAAVDSAGNIWIAGETDSDDFPLVNPIFAQKVPYRVAGFVLEISPSPMGATVVFATYLTGQEGVTATTGINVCSASATAIATDSAGNVYVGGNTNEADFLASPAVNLNSTPCTDNFGNSSYVSFALKISTAGKLVYGKRVMTGASMCVGGSRCVNQLSTLATANNLAIDSTGALTVAGTASGSWNPGNGYILKLAPDGSSVQWSTTTPSTFQAVLALAMAQDSSGNIDLLGQYASVIAVGGLDPTAVSPGLFAAQLKPDGSGFNYVTDLGQSNDVQVAGMVLDSAGRPYLAGTSSSAQFPTVAGAPNLGPDFVLQLDTAGAVQMLFGLPHGAVMAPPAFDLKGNLLLAGANNWVATLPLSYTTPAVVAFANSASYALNTGILPGALVTLFGFGLPSSKDDVQISMGNLPVPILYGGSNQINLQVPFELGDGEMLTTLQIDLPGATLSLQMPWSPSLGVFTLDGTHAAALNQDGTVNSASNPAAAGSIVTMFGTGAFWPSGMQDGAVATAAAPAAVPIQLVADLEILNALYSGAAPGLINGVFQVNVQLPAQPSMPLTLQENNRYGVGTLSSNAVLLYLQ